MKEIKSFDGTKIAYSIERQKSQIFLIFIHGAGGNLTAWKKEREFFKEKGVSTLALDLRGHGLSGRPNKVKDYTLKNFAKDIKAVIDAEKIKKFILVGHCFGGMITLEFQKLYPNIAISYILVGTASKAPSKLKTIRNISFPLLLIFNVLLRLRSLWPSKQQNHQEDFDRFIGTGDWNLLRIYSDISYTSFRSWFYTYENIANFDGTKVLKDIAVPVLIIQGEQDKIFSVEDARRTNSLINKSILDIMPDSNHITVINNPIILAEKIYAFYNKII